MKRKIDTFIKREFPIGTKVEQVISSLDSLNIEHSIFLEKERIVYAILRDTSQGLMIKGAIQIEFFFDKNNLLIKYSINELFTGP